MCSKVLSKYPFIGKLANQRSVFSVPWIFFLFVCWFDLGFWSTPDSAQDLFLSLSSEITAGRDQGTIWGARIKLMSDACKERILSNLSWILIQQRKWTQHWNMLPHGWTYNCVWKEKCQEKSHTPYQTTDVKCPEEENHRNGKQWEVAKECVQGPMCRISFWSHGNVRELDSGFGCTTLWLH